MTVQEVVENFRNAAIAKGDFADAARDNKLHKEMTQSFLILNSQGEVGRSAFKDLLRDKNNYVRAWVAAQLLSEGDSTVLPVLQEIEKSSGLLAFDAKMTIREFESGRLQSPFKGCK